jgi:hypothetical protein
MRIHIEPIQQPYVTLLTKAGILTVDEGENGEICISLGQHFTLKICGKEDPLILLDSQEKPTRLRILQSESHWVQA